MSSDVDGMDKGVGRLFLGVSLPGNVRRALDLHLHRLPGDPSLPGRVVPPDNWHLTLRFLGDSSAAAADRLRYELQRTPLGPAFELELGNLGAFPRPARATVLWLGTLRGTERLRELAARVEAAVARAGYEPETREFSAHLTLSRIRPPQDVRFLIAGFDGPRVRFGIEDVTLFRRQLGRGPARYDALERFPLSH